MGCPIYHLKSHLAWTFSPCIDLGIFTRMHTRSLSKIWWGIPSTIWKVISHGHFHLMWTLSPHMGIFALHRHSHLVWTFSPHIHTYMLPATWKKYFSPGVEKFPKHSQSNPNSNNEVPLRATNYLRGNSLDVKSLFTMNPSCKIYV